jgi:hypothetical protein
MTRTAQPQSMWLTTASLNTLRMSKIIKSSRPFIVSRNHETHCRLFGQLLNGIDVDTSGSLSGRTSQHALDDLGPGAFGTQILHQLGD